MKTEKKRRKKENTEDNNLLDEQHAEETLEEQPKIKSKKKGEQKNEKDNTPKKKKRKSEKSIESVVQSQSASVHLDSLQSIFASKDEEDNQFTLFGSEPVSQPTVEVSTPTLPLSVTPAIEIAQGERQPRYFFPHYDSPEKNVKSLFAGPDEPFFYDRTEFV